jgi:hypothetical protein
MNSPRVLKKFRSYIPDLPSNGLKDMLRVFKLSPLAAKQCLGHLAEELQVGQA